eukprot:311698_1
MTNIIKSIQNTHDKHHQIHYAIDTLIEPNVMTVLPLTGYYAEYGTLLSALNRKQEAQKTFELAITINPNQHKMHYRYAKLLHGMGRHIDAIHALQNACALSPTNTEYQRLLNIMSNKNKNLKRKLRISRSESITKTPQELVIATINSNHSKVSAGQNVYLRRARTITPYDSNLSTLKAEVYEHVHACAPSEVPESKTENQQIKWLKKINDDQISEIERLKRLIATDKQRSIYLESELLISRQDVSNPLRLSNDELCQRLQENLENYMVDQKKNAKKKKKTTVLSELKLFHDCRAQTIRNWNEKLKKKHFSDLLEILDDKLEEEYQDDDDMDSEQIAYNILFDIVVECHAVLYTEYTKIYHKEYLNASAIDMVLMNMSIFYKLLNNPKLTSLTKRIANIISYINDKIGMIYMRISAKYVEYIHIIDKDTLYRFIVTCCEIMWSVLHYNYTIYPKTFEVNETDRKYDEIVHEREAAYKGDIIQYFAFPAIMCDKQYVTKMWIVCND